MDDQHYWSVANNMASKRILIVNDVAETRFTLSRRLHREGYLVTSASRGADALNIIEQGEIPNLILLDAIMPEMDGFALAREIRKSSNVPIIMQLAIADIETKVEDIIEFTDDHVTKPYDFGELAVRIWCVLTRYSSRMPQF